MHLNLCLNADPHRLLFFVTDGNGNPRKDYVYLNGEPVAMKVYGGSAGWYWFINDHLGTPQKMVDESGSVVWAAAYAPFGEARVFQDEIINNLRFPGQYYDVETGLHYNWHRYYDPGTGRYLRPDPIGLAGGVNVYTYVSNNPLNFVDPTGLLFGFNAGENFGASAAQYWADKQISTGNFLYSVPGVFASLWTPETSSASAVFLAGPLVVQNAARGGIVANIGESAVTGAYFLAATLGPLATNIAYNTTPYSQAIMDFAYGLIPATGPPQGWGNFSSGGLFFFEIFEDFLSNKDCEIKK